MYKNTIHLKKKNTQETPALVLNDCSPRRGFAETCTSMLHLFDIKVDFRVPAKVVIGYFSS